MKRLLFSLVILFSLSLGYLFAQNPTLYYDFEPSSSGLIIGPVSKNEAVYVVDLQEPHFAEGIKGVALDLSEDAFLRSSLKPKDVKVLTYSKSSSFAIQVWIKTTPDTAMGTPIAGM